MLKPSEVVQRDEDGTIVLVRCRVCGEAVKLQGSYGTPRPVLIEGHTRLIQSVKLIRLGNYREVELLLDGGGRHVTCVCEKCKGVTDMAVWDEVYHIDLQELEANGPFKRKLRPNQRGEMHRHKAKWRGQVDEVAVK